MPVIPRSVRLRRVSLALVAIAAFAGCDSNESEKPSSFRAEIAAEESVVSLSGDVTAGYTRELDTEALGFSISMNDPEAGAVNLFKLRGRPETGSYSLQDYLNLSDAGIAEGSFVGLAVVWEETLNYRSTSGTVTITTSTPSRVSGHFEFAAAPVGDMPSENVTVEGSFDVRFREPLQDFPEDL